MSDKDLAVPNPLLVHWYIVCFSYFGPGPNYLENLSAARS